VRGLAAWAARESGRPAAARALRRGWGRLGHEAEQAWAVARLFLFSFLFYFSFFSIV